MTNERTAIYYGKVKLILGVICDGYVLDDGTAVMSERGTADLLGMDQMALNRMKTTWPPKVLKPFISNDFSMKTTWPSKVLKPFTTTYTMEFPHYPTFKPKPIITLNLQKAY